jgi:hypothetical protein
MAKEKISKIRCKKCGSTQNYIGKRENVRVCRKCGHEEKLEIKNG